MIITIYDKFTNVMFRSVTPPNQQGGRKRTLLGTHPTITKLL